MGQFCASITPLRGSVFGERQHSAKLFNAGVDLAYRPAVVSDLSRTDEWVAALAINLDELDPDTRKVVDSWCCAYAPEEGAGKATPRRLLAFVVCGQKVVKMQPFTVVAVETEYRGPALVPCIFTWSIPQPGGGAMAVNHLEPSDELLEFAGRLISVVDSSHAAKLMEEQIRGRSQGTMH